MNAAPTLPTPNLVRAALAAWAEEMGARLVWDACWPTHPDDPDLLPGNFVGVLSPEVDRAANTGVLRVFAIGPSEADDPDGDGAAQFTDDFWDALTDHGWFVQGSRIPFEPIYLAVNREAFAAYLVDEAQA